MCSDLRAGCLPPGSLPSILSALSGLISYLGHNDPIVPGLLLGAATNPLGRKEIHFWYPVLAFSPESATDQVSQVDFRGLRCTLLEVPWPFHPLLCFGGRYTRWGGGNCSYYTGCRVEGGLVRTTGPSQTDPLWVVETGPSHFLSVSLSSKDPTYHP